MIRAVFVKRLRLKIPPKTRAQSVKLMSKSSVLADSFDRVLVPKVTGSMTLHQVFPVGSLDFIVLFSSCRQLFGFPRQGSYASGNGFLDTLASRRWEQGDNRRGFQWTSWRGIGMAASTDFINAELESKGVTDISRDEALQPGSTLPSTTRTRVWFCAVALWKLMSSFQHLF